jgi:outer membrane protein assembly factor BamB
MRKGMFLIVLALYVLVLPGCSGPTTGTSASPSPALSPSASPTPTLDPSAPAPLSVYTTAQDGTVAALNASDGKVRWDSSISGTKPILANGVVYVGSNSQDVYALSANSGTLLWHTQITHLEDSPLTVMDGVLYAHSTDNRLYALSTRDGSLRWHSQQGGDVIAVSNGMVYVQSSSGVSALNASNGSLLWNYRSAGDDTALWAISGNQAYAVEEYRGEGDVTSNRLHVLNQANGKEQWGFAAGKTVLSLVGIENGIVYLHARTPNTALPDAMYALNTSDGSVRWHAQLQDGQTGIPMFANKTIYIAAPNGYISALNAANGKALWRIRIPLSDPAITVPQVVAISDGAVYTFFLNQGFWALSASDGSVKWSKPTQDAIQTTVLVDAAIYGHTATRNTANNYVFSLNARDGSVKWRYDTGSNIPAISVG